LNIFFSNLKILPGLFPLSLTLALLPLPGVWDSYPSFPLLLLFSSEGVLLFCELDGLECFLELEYVLVLTIEGDELARFSLLIRFLLGGVSNCEDD
jgi:hypothetical protein